jgi:hypothetical protein
MTKLVRDYFAHRMEDPAYAAAYQELEEEYQAERARIQARIQRGPLWQALKEVEEYFSTHPDLVRILDLLQQMGQQQALLTHILPARQQSYANAGFQISSEAGYEANFISTEVSYNDNIP